MASDEAVELVFSEVSLVVLGHEAACSHDRVPDIGLIKQIPNFILSQFVSFVPLDRHTRQASQGHRFFTAVQLEVIVHVFSHGLLKNGQPPSACLGRLRVVGLHSFTCRVDTVSLLARPFPKVLERDAIIKRQVVPLAESEELKNVPAVVWSRAVGEDLMDARAMLGNGGGRGEEPTIAETALTNTGRNDIIRTPEVVVDRWPHPNDLSLVVFIQVAGNVIVLDGL